MTSDLRTDLLGLTYRLATAVACRMIDSVFHTELEKIIFCSVMLEICPLIFYISIESLC